MQRLFFQAEKWRSWYPEHINGKDHRTIFVRSSESPRCNETISAILHTLLSTGPEGLNPIPIYSPPPGYDKYVSVVGYEKDVSAEMRKVYQVCNFRPSRYSVAYKILRQSCASERSKSAHEFGLSARPAAGCGRFLNLIAGALLNLYLICSVRSRFWRTTPRRRKRCMR